MLRRIKPIFGNLALLGGSLLACFAALEYGLFKYVLIPDGVIHNVTINNVVRYRPNTRAVFREPDGSQNLITVNADGWNSTKPRYKVEKTPGVLRVAVVGDSYVHGASVDVDKSFAHVIEQQLNARGIRAEVYRFGVDGAPLSQYLHMLRREVIRYKPDVVLFQLIHNDFDESYRFLFGRYASSFLKVRPKESGGFTEVAPEEFVPGFADFARGFRTFRYLYYETELHTKIRHIVNRVWWGGEAVASTKEMISSAVDIRNIQDQDTIWDVSHYVLRQIKYMATAYDFKPAFVMDGVREAVYSGEDRKTYEVAELNEIAAELTEELDLPFVDMQDVFAAHYRKHKTRFEFTWDWHWNELANRLVGETAVSLLLDDPRLLGTKQPARVSENRRATITLP